MKKPKILLLFLLFLFLAALPVSARGNREDTGENLWESAGEQINNSFFFVVDKVVDMQGYFIWYAKGIGRVVFLIAVFSAGLNHALTGTGLKENLIKIFKATVFFMIVISAYPRIISWITTQTFNMAYGSVGSAVEDYFNNATREIVTEVEKQSDYKIGAGKDTTYSKTTTTEQVIDEVKLDSQNLFSDITVKRKHPRLGEYTAVAPANLLKILFLMARDFIKFSDEKSMDFGRVIKGLACAGFTIATGCFALLEYIVCFLEFMLVTSVGVILFPLSIWEGSKFMSEKFIGAVVGFFMKMLFCNIAIFLLLYGFISLFYTYNGSGGFQGSADQIIFVVFSCLLFFYICKSAPGIAQSLLTGTPSLSASGAISAAAGAVGGAMAATKLAGKATGTVVGGVTKAGFALVGANKEANAAKTSAMQEVAEAGGNKDMVKQAGNNAYRSSLASSAGDSFKTAGLGLTRRLLGDKSGGGSQGGGGTNPHSWRQDFLNEKGGEGNQTVKEHFDKRADEGTRRGKASAAKDLSRWQGMGFQPTPPPQPEKTEPPKPVHATDNWTP